MSLDVVETAEVSSSEPSAYDQGGEHVPGPFEPPAAPQPAPAAVAAPAAPLLPDDSLGSAAAVEPAIEPASQPASEIVAAHSTESDLVEPDDSEPVEPEAQAPVDARPTRARDRSGKRPKTATPTKTATPARGPAEDVDDDVDVAEVGQLARDQDDDVHYPPVGTLIAGADVFYPALDQDDGHAALRELASVLLDDGIFDPDQASDFLEAQRSEGLPVPARQEGTTAVALGRQRRSRPRTATAPASRKARISWPIPMSCGRCTTPICNEPIQSIWHREQSKQPPCQSAPTFPP